MVSYRASHTGHVIYNHEGQKRIKQAVAAAEEPAKPAADSGENELNEFIVDIIREENPVAATASIDAYTKSDFWGKVIELL